MADDKVKKKKEDQSNRLNFLYLPAATAIVAKLRDIIICAIYQSSTRHHLIFTAFPAVVPAFEKP